MRHMLIASLDVLRPSATSDPLARPVNLADAHGLAELMLTAYRGTIDDGGETMDDAIADVGRLFDGAYGEFNFAASEVIEREGSLAAATMVTTYQGRPFIAFSMTAPRWKRHGLARAGLARAMARLHAAGEHCVRLVVTEGNTAAQTLYASMGFVPE